MKRITQCCGAAFWPPDGTICAQCHDHAAAEPIRIELTPVDVVNLALAALPPGAVVFTERGIHLHTCHCCGDALARCDCELTEPRQPEFCVGCYAAMCEDWERGYEDRK